MCRGVQCSIAIITSEAALVPALWYGHFTSILHISVTVSQFPPKKTVKFYGYFGQSTSINMATLQE